MANQKAVFCLKGREDPLQTGSCIDQVQES